ncbi:MAG: magnesium transporter CorA family protein [Candidatus Hodarchaeota archaeon]
MIEVQSLGSLEAPELENALQTKTWVKVTSPTPFEIERLTRVLKLDPELVEDCLDPEERPRFESEDDYVLLVLRIPLSKAERDIPSIVTFPIGIFLSENFLVTVQARELPFLSAKPRRRAKFYLDNPRNLLHYFIRRITIEFQRSLDVVEEDIDELQEEVLTSSRPDSLPSLFLAAKVLVYLNAAIMADIKAMNDLRRHSKDPVWRDTLEDLEIDLQQVSDMINIQREILTSTMDAYASAISNNLNVVMKVLASISLILMIPTLLASLYGMNLDLPLADDPNAFWIIFGFGALLSLISVAMLWWQEWI